MFKTYYKYGTMNSSKTANLLMVAHNYNSKGVKAFILSPRIDTRNGVGNVSARAGLSAKADLIVEDGYTLGLHNTLVKAYQENGVIMVDEAQFIKPDVVHQIVKECKILDYSHPRKNDNFALLAYGLLTDFQDRLFPGSKAWVEEADSLHEIKTVCHFCNRKATRNLLTKHTTDSEIQIGDSEYLSVCSYHYYKMAGDANA